MLNDPFLLYCNLCIGYFPNDNSGNELIFILFLDQLFDLYEP